MSTRLTRRITSFLVCLSILGAPATVFAAAGDLDCTFGTGGIVNLDLGSAEAARDAALQGGDRIVTLGSASGAIRLSRFLPGGDLDPSFGSGGTVSHAFTGLTFSGGLAIDGLDRIVVSGSISVASDSEVFVARFTPDGAVDTSFGGGDGWVSFDWTPATAGTGIDNGGLIAVDATHRPVVGGWTDANGLTFNPSNRNMAVARLTTAGALDGTFGTAGIAIASSPGTANDDDLRAMKIDAAGRIVGIGATAYPNAFNSGPRNTILVRWTSAGALDTTFDSDGVLLLDMSGAGTDDFGIDLNFDSAGRIVALGQGTDDPLLARLNADGTLDTTFSGDGLLQQSFLGGQDVVEHVLVQADDKLLVTGWPVNGFTFHIAIMRFTTAGVLDSAWGGSGVVTTLVGFNERIYSAVLQPDQRLVVAGGLANDTDLVMARYLNDADTITTTTSAITSDPPDPSPIGVGVPVGVSVTASSGLTSPTGTVAVSDGVDSCSLTLAPAGGTTATGSCAVSFSTAGNRTLTAQYQGGGTFCRSSATEPHQVLAATTSTAITADSPDPSLRGQPVTVSYSVTSPSPGIPIGNVTVTDGIDTCIGTVATGSCNLAFSTVGTRSLTATYAGDASFSGSVSATEPHQVNPAATTTSISTDLPDPSLVGQPVTVAYTVAIMAPGAGTPTGNVTVSDGVDSCVGTVAAGSCNLAFSTVGTRSLTATYAGDASFNGSVSAAEAHQVDQAATTTSISADVPDPSLVGQPVTVSYTVTVNAPGTGTPTGNVTVTDGVDSCTATVAAGSCSVAFSTLGARSLTATYAGDASFSGSVSAAEAHQVDQAATTTSISADVPDPSLVGQPVTVSYTVTVNAPGTGTPTGNVTVTDGVDSCTATVAAGSCSVAFSTLGARSLTATYAGDASFSGSVSAAEAHQVDQAATTTSISADVPDPSLVGQPVTVSYTVTVNAPGTGTPTGNVTVTDGVDSCTATVAAGSCSVAFSTLGARSLTATYAGDASFNSSVSAAEAHQVDQAATTTSISADVPDPSLVGQPVTVSYTVTVNAPGTGTPTGNVTVTDGVDSCTATVAAGSCSVAFSTLGARSLTATYAGDASFNSSVSAAEAHQVDQAATTTSISADVPDPSLVGQPVTVSYTVTVNAPGTGTPTGNVTVTDGVDSCTATVAAGSCSVALSTLGARTLTATYGGDGAFSPSTSPTEPHQVAVAATTTTLVSHTPDPSVFGQTVTMVYSVTAASPGIPSGNVTVSDGVDSCTATVAAGSCTVALTTVGLRTLTATYSGDSIFGGSSDTVAHTVLEAPTATTILSLTPNPAPLGSEVMVTFVVDALPPGGGFPTGVVTVDDGAGNGCSASILAAGCTFVVTAIGQFTITASYPGDGSYGPSLATADEELVVQEELAVAVPTLGEIGLVLFGLLLAAAALPILRRA